ncbi:hypothetical protein ACFQY7_23590 [Actinomadura luteofluorescens]|uniref:Uncharacterized protein n=1 Tax=Actinomadura luteofluorescens TaxID=46163 RepID=A0A7Y9ENI6_9ACTN|nr:hypothetical protein [Actinomadura luteofluorescens]NYD50869.1 hypothetical protein [Actinomadura luteofluorescens]
MTTPGGAVVHRPDGVAYLYTVSTVAAGSAPFSVIDTGDGSRESGTSISRGTPG